MVRLLIRRLLYSIPVILVSTIMVFLIIHLAPGNPAQTLAGPDATPATVRAIRLRLGLTGPLYRQYFSWIASLLHGRLGESYISSEPIARLLPPRMIATGELLGAAAIVSIVAGIAIGSVAGLRPGRLADSVASWLIGIMVSTPEFWIGLLLILAFAVKLGWLPPEGSAGLSQDPTLAVKSLILPTVTLAFQPTAYIARSVRSSVVETVSEDYVRTAQAKGVVGLRFYVRHILKNSLVPILTIIGLLLTRMLGADIVVETVFAWPGVGSLLATSIANRDYQVVQDCLLLFILAVIAVNFLTDISYGLVDPRIRVDVRKKGLW